jgi:hypothetical protein
MGTFKGLGYVDYLNLSVRPWRLPFDELRWGRYLSAQDSIIWMDFKGAFPETFVVRNGVTCRRASVTDDDIHLEDEGLALSFGDRQILRDGTLVSTALSVVPGIRSVLPARMLFTRETKWRSRGILRKGESTVNTGWTIHEVVRWPQRKSP